MKRMMTTLAASAVLALAGCVQVQRFSEGARYYSQDGSHPYLATKWVASRWVTAPARTFGWADSRSVDCMGDAYLTLSWPLGVIDLPCEAVFDTVMCVPDWVIASGRR